MGLQATTTNLSYARNEYIGQGRHHVLDKCADMIYYILTNNDITTARTGPLTVGSDGDGEDVIFYGDTAEAHLYWDADTDYLHLDGTTSRFQIGDFNGATAGSGITITNSRSAALKVYADDNDTDMGSGTLGRAIWGRMLSTVGSQNAELAGIQGSIVVSTGEIIHNAGAIWGSLEARGTSSLNGTAGQNIFAAVMGRVGVGSGAALDIKTGAVCAGVAAVSNINDGSTTTQTGITAAFYVGQWPSTDNWDYGLYIADSVGVAIHIASTVASTTTATGSIVTLGGVGIAKGLFVGEVVSVGTVCQPDTNSGAALGTTSLQWSDLFLATTAVINWDNGEITLTHSEVGKLAIAATWTTVGAVGRPFVSNLTTEVQLGSYANALKGNVSLGTDGGASGLLSAVCCEITMATSGDSGNYAAVELEMSYGSTSGSLPHPCFIYANTNGTAKGDFDTYGDFIKIADGLTAGTGKMIGTGTSTLRIGTGALCATKRYIPLSTVAETYTTAYPIATTSTIISTCTTAGISCTASTLNASSGRIGKFVGSVADAAQGDGYGVFEMQANFSGTVPSGSVANAASFWINFSGGTVTAGTMICVQNNGIWAPAGLTLSTSNFVIGMRMHCEIGGGTQPREIFCFSTNIVANHITSLWQINVIEDINTTSTKSGSSVAVPFLKTSAGTQYYVNAFTS